EAFSLAVDGGGIAIDPGQTLSVVNDAVFASGTTLTLGNGATFSAGSGSIPTITNPGSITIGATGSGLSAAGYDDSVPVATAHVLTKTGAGSLSFRGSVQAAQTTFMIEEGSLALKGAGDPLDGIGAVTLAGGTLMVTGGTTSVPDQLEASIFIGGPRNADLVRGIGDGTGEGGLLGKTPLQTLRIAQTLHMNEDIDFQTFFPAFTQVDDYQSLFMGAFTAPETGTYEFGTLQSDDEAVIYLDLNQNGVFETGAGEEIVYRGCCGEAFNTVDLIIGETYAYAAAHHEYGGGSNIRPTIQLPGGARIDVDPGDGAQAGLWSVVGYDSIVSTKNITVTAPSTLRARTDGTASFGAVTLQDGAELTTDGAVGGFTFTGGTTIVADAARVGFNPVVDTDYGTIANNSTRPELTIAKVGAGTWVLDQPVAGATGYSNVAWQVEGGTLELRANNVLGARPIAVVGGALRTSGAFTIGSAAITLDGGTFEVIGEESDIANVLSWAKYEGGNSAANLTGIDDFILNGQNGGLFALTPSQQGAWTAAVDDDTVTTGDNYAFMWSGSFTAPVTGDYTFATRADDYEVLWMDLDRNGDFEEWTGEQLALNIDPEPWDTEHTATVTLTAGQTYPLAFAYYENGGGEYGRLWITPPGGAQTFVNPGDAAQDGWWAGHGRGAVDVSDASLTIVSDSTIHAVTDIGATLAAPTLVGGILTTTSTQGKITFQGINIDPSATRVGFDPQTETDYGTIANNSTQLSLTIVKGGPSTWVLDTPVQGATGTGNVTWQVEQGTLQVTGASPLGGRPIVLAGGTLDLKGTVAAADPAAGLVAYYSFNNASDMGHDDSGNGLDVAAVGGPTQAFGGAALLDGVDDYFLSTGVNGVPGAVGNGDHTVIGWVKSTKTGWQTALSAHGADGSNRFVASDVVGGRGLCVLDAFDGAANVWSYTNIPLHDAQWHMIGWQLDSDGDLLGLIQDGQTWTDMPGSDSGGVVTRPDGTTTTEFPPDGKFSIGQDWDGAAASDFFGGLMDEVSVYDRVLSSTELAAVYAGVFQAVAMDMSTVDVTVTEDSTLNLDVVGSVPFRSLTLENGTFNVQGLAMGKVSFTDTTFAAGAQQLGVSTTTPTYLGATTADGVTPTTVTKTGASDLIIDGLATGLQSTTFDVQEGRLVGVATAANGNPVEGALLQVGGGEIVLAGPTTGGAVTFGNQVEVVGNGTLTAGTGGVGLPGPQTVTLGNSSHGLNVADGAALAIRSTDDYTMNVAGNLSGDGRISVAEGTVTLSGSANTIGSMQITGGTVSTATNDVRITDSLGIGGAFYTISDGQTFAVSGSDLATGRLLTVDAGTLQISGSSSGGASEGMVAFWAFDEGPGNTQAADSVGSNTGTLTNMDANTAWVPGKTGDAADYALQFDGSTNLVEAPFAEALNGESFTFGAWARVDGGSSHRALISSRNDGPQQGYICYVEPAGNLAFWTGPGWDNLGGPTPVVGDWVHVTGTFEAAGDGTGTKTLYVHDADGNLLDSPTITHRCDPNPMRNFRIGAGANEGNPNYFFNGLIDNVFIYERALSAQEVDSMVDYTPTSSTEPLVLSGTDLVVTGNATISSPSETVTLGDLTAQPGVTALDLAGASYSFQNVSIAGSVTLNGEMSVRGALDVGDGVAGTVTVRGDSELAFGSDATYNAEVILGDAPTAAAPDQIVLAANSTVYLDGTLAPKAVGRTSAGFFSASTMV
ncbi:MAG: hypothetical protein HQ567_34525, partial [Candidatus Nealsonbacteria bacterium]|nr:hypothetical protein [Candidatus Nealsonbacteria bacterium]